MKALRESEQVPAYDGRSPLTVVLRDDSTNPMRYVVHTRNDTYGGHSHGAYFSEDELADAHEELETRFAKLLADVPEDVLADVVAPRMAR